jgi:hypothetical protein
MPPDKLHHDLESRLAEGFELIPCNIILGSWDEVQWIVVTCDICGQAAPNSQGRYCSHLKPYVFAFPLGRLNPPDPKTE